MSENSVLFDGLARLRQARVVCVGDIMLDRFVYGAVDRISPEAPIPVLRVSREKTMLGGVGNVAANIAALGGQVAMVAAVARDSAGAQVRALLAEMGTTAALVELNDRETTVKSRFISGTQQMLRVDREKTGAISKEAEAEIVARAAEQMDGAGAVILSDYKKGVLTDGVITGVIAAARQRGIPVIVDPKDTNFARYKGATVITPNRKELEAATGMGAAQDEEVRAAAMHLLSQHGFEAVLATRSQDGMSYITAAQDPLHVPAHVREIFDVSGAGDTVIAMLATAFAAGLTPRHAVLLSNIAAGIVVGKPGTATVRPDEIEQVLHAGYAVERQAHGGRSKLASLPAAADAAERKRVRGHKVGFTNGCFDLLHPGHLSSLRQAKEACDFLVVAINSDASVRKLKGPERPVQNETARAAILSALEMVDMVVVFDADTPIDLIRAIKPDVLVKGGQYKLEEVVGYDVVMSYGGKIVRAEMEEGFSTTSTIARIAG